MKFVVISIIFLILFLPSVVLSAGNLDQINQQVCDRFETDVARLAAIMEEIKDRKGIKETRVAFGGIDTPVKTADYKITYAAEAIAYQRSQKYQSQTQLRNSLEVLRNKILSAKISVWKVLSED